MIIPPGRPFMFIRLFQTLASESPSDKPMGQVGCVCVCVCVCVLGRFSHVQPFATPWTVAHQAPLSMGLSRQEYWSGLPCPPPGDLTNPGIKPTSLMFPALAGKFFTTSAT